MPVPILLVTGFLGAGKTTVVNHLLAHAEGRRIAAVVNDFGAINIDAELIAGASDGVVSLANGCICCSLEGDLLRTLSTLLRRDPKPEYIVIETSGVADPAEIVRNLMDPVILREAPLETVLCVIDAATPPSALDDALHRSQLRVADIVALTKLMRVRRCARPSARSAFLPWWSMRRTARFRPRCCFPRPSIGPPRDASPDRDGRQSNASKR